MNNRFDLHVVAKWRHMVLWNVANIGKGNG